MYSAAIVGISGVAGSPTSVDPVTGLMRLSKIGDADFDSLAEEFMLRAAALAFPNPPERSVLGLFYRDQQYKPTGRVIPKAGI